MAEEKIELVSRCCPKDCVYMAYIDGGATPICYYAVIESECRKCSVSKCDKYKGGKPIRPRMKQEYILYWEREVYGDDADIIW